MIPMINRRIGVPALICAAGLTVAVVTAVNANAQPIGEICIETGTQLSERLFFDDVPEDCAFTTDVSAIDTSVPGTYSLTITYNRVFSKTVLVTVIDTTAPVGQAVYKHFYAGDIPDAADCVTGAYDLSGVVNISYGSDMPDLSLGGDYDVPVVLTDRYGNSSVISVPFTVTDDHNAPLIYGPCEMVAGVNTDYMSGITVTDDYDDNPEYGCNYSAVDPDVTGEYPIIYWALDEAGNYTQTTVTAVVIDEDAIDYSGSAYDIAASVLSTVRRRSKVDTARAIFNYVHDNIKYRHTPDCTTIESAAYYGFTEKEGNCYVLASCCKLMLDRAGIPNMIIKRYPVTDSSHFWNLVYLNGGWYHCDATSFMGHSGIYFMLTDAQLDQYHCFDSAAYPARAGGPAAGTASSEPAASSAAGAQTGTGSEDCGSESLSGSSGEEPETDSGTTGSSAGAVSDPSVSDSTESAASGVSASSTSGEPGTSDSSVTPAATPAPTTVTESAQPDASGAD